MRTCIGCRKVVVSTELVRVCRDERGALRIGRGYPGRGAWLCAGAGGEMPSEKCFQQAARHQAFDRALRAPVSASEVDALRVVVQERARIEKGDAVGVAARRD